VHGAIYCAPLGVANGLRRDLANGARFTAAPPLGVSPLGDRACRTPEELCLKRDKMMKIATKTFVSLHTAPYPFVLITCIASIALAFLDWLGWDVWLIALCVLAAWIPLIFFIMKSIYRKHGALAFMFILVVGQTLHLVEHITVEVQMHILNIPATGIISILNVEWVHFLWTSWVLAFSVFLVFLFPKNMWLFRLFLFSIWHEIEHIVIMSVYLRTGVVGSPGLLSKGGAIGGGLPIIRPDLHSIYVLIQEVLLLLAYRDEIRRIALGNDVSVESHQVAISSENDTEVSSKSQATAS